MDYEKMYNEALEDMRAIYPNLKGDAKIAVEHAFPELAESDDERIRMELVAFFKGMQDSDWHEKYWHDLEIDRILAYLEKQKEQKPVSISCGHENDAEWSEEDEKMLTDISWAIRHCAYDDKKKERVMKWFNDDYRKALRPSWKPNDEQMEALKDAVRLFKETHFENFHYKIESLYEQLKSIQ